MDGIEQLPPGAVLQDKLDLIVILVDVEEVGDVGDAAEGAEDLALVEAAMGAPPATAKERPPWTAMVLPHGRRPGALPPPSGAAGGHDLELGQTLDGDQRGIGSADGQPDRARGPVAQYTALRGFRQVVGRVDALVRVAVGQPNGGGFARLAIFGQAEAFALPPLRLALARGD